MNKRFVEKNEIDYLIITFSIQLHVFTSSLSWLMLKLTLKLTSTLTLTLTLPLRLTLK